MISKKSSSTRDVEKNVLAVKGHKNEKFSQEEKFYHKIGSGDQILKYKKCLQCTLRK